jgi:hypothetical protein
VWTFAQLLIVTWTIACPIGVWRKLGDLEFVAGLDPRLQRAYGVRLYTGTNGKTYVEPPPPLKRLKVSLLMGLLSAALLGAVLALVARFFQ